jgi:hypothetical protein
VRTVNLNPHIHDICFGEVCRACHCSRLACFAFAVRCCGRCRLGIGWGHPHGEPKTHHGADPYVKSIVYIGSHLVRIPGTGTFGAGGRAR